MQFSKQLFAILAVLISINASAQFSKGDKMIGASVGSLVFNSGSADITVASIGSNTSLIKNHSVNISPSVAWFLSDNIAVGFTLNVNPNGQKVTYEQDGTTYQSDKSDGMNIGAGGFARMYLKSGGSLLPFGQAGFNAGVSNLKTEGFFYGGSGVTAYKRTYTGKTTSGSFLNIALTAGVTKMLGENAGLDLSLGYVYSTNKNTFKRTTLQDDGNNGSIDSRAENETTTSFTNNGLVVNVGFQIFIRGKKK
jgi:outer membrane protein W